MGEETGPRSATPPLRNALSNAMSRIKRDHYGRGPARARTYIFGRVVISVLDDVLIPAELALKEARRADLVRRTRLAFEEVMADTFTSAVEDLTGAKVVGYHSQIVFDPDQAIEMFVLDRPVGTDGEGAPDRGEGPLRAAIANGLLGLLHEYWGKGPPRSRVFLEDEFVFGVFEEPFTTVERTLLEAGERDLVRDLRIEFHDARHAAFDEEVAAATGRRVLASVSQVVFDPDLLFLCFVLKDRPGAG